jgi:hypothetical protein
LNVSQWSSSTTEIPHPGYQYITAKNANNADTVSASPTYYSDVSSDDGTDISSSPSIPEGTVSTESQLTATGTDRAGDVFEPRMSKGFPRNYPLAPCTLDSERVQSRLSGLWQMRNDPSPSAPKTPAQLFRNISTVADKCQSFSRALADEIWTLAKVTREREEQLPALDCHPNGNSHTSYCAERLRSIWPYISHELNHSPDLSVDDHKRLSDALGWAWTLPQPAPLTQR